VHGCVCTAHRSDPRGLLWGRQIKRLHAEKEELEQQVEMLQARCRKIEEEASEQRALDEKKHADEVRAWMYMHWRVCLLPCLTSWRLCARCVSGGTLEVDQRQPKA